MGVIIGGPEKPEKDERPAFYIHKNLLCYTDTQPDGVYVEGKTPSGGKLFRKHFPHMGAAISYINKQKEIFSGNKSDKK